MTREEMLRFVVRASAAGYRVIDTRTGNVIEQCAKEEDARQKAARINEDGFDHYAPGEIVIAQDPHARTWREARVEKDAPYPKGVTGGAYVAWNDLKDPASWESRGGWIPSHSIRRKNEEDARG